MEELLKLLWKALLQPVSLLFYSLPTSPISGCGYVCVCICESVGGQWLSLCQSVSACLCLSGHVYSCFGDSVTRENGGPFASPSPWFCAFPPALISDSDL